MSKAFPRDLDATDLRLMVAAADQGSFRKAAELLQVDVAQVSRRVGRLEADLGVLTFERSTSGVRLTPAGETIIALARRALEDLEAIRVNAFRQEPRSVIRVGTHLSSMTSEFRARLSVWRRVHPQVDFDLIEMDDRSVVNALQQGTLDAVLAFEPAWPRGLPSLRLYEEPLFLAVGGMSSLIAHERVTWKDLRGRRLLVKAWPESGLYRDLQAGLIGAPAEFRAHEASISNLLNLVAVGEGEMIVMGYHRELCPAGVTFKPIAEADAIMPIVLGWRDGLQDERVERFLRYLRGPSGLVFEPRSLR